MASLIISVDLVLNMFEKIKQLINLRERNSRLKAFWMDFKAKAEDEYDMRIEDPLTILTVGLSGSGKSALINEMFGLQTSVSHFASTHGTLELTLIPVRAGSSINVYDTKGLSSWDDPKLTEQIDQVLSQRVPIDIVLVVWDGSTHRFSKEFKDRISPLEKLGIPVYYVMTHAYRLINEESLANSVISLLDCYVDEPVLEIREFRDALSLPESLKLCSRSLEAQKALFRQFMMGNREKIEQALPADLYEFQGKAEEIRSQMLKKFDHLQELLEKWNTTFITAPAGGKVFPVELVRELKLAEKKELTSLKTTLKIIGTEKLPNETLKAKSYLVGRGFNVGILMQHLIRSPSTREKVIKLVLNRFDYEFEEGLFRDEIVQVQRTFDGEEIKRIIVSDEISN